MKLKDKSPKKPKDGEEPPKKPKDEARHWRANEAERGPTQVTKEA